MADIINSVKNVGSTFTSWDSCMSKTYCKWPVIAAIIIGSLIVLSVLWCLFSCLCCGISLCAACGRCITCFGCCGLCSNNHSPRRRNKDPEYHPMPPTPTPYQPGGGYQPQSNMSYNSGPQFATFDAGSKRANGNGTVHEDALPSMPSWDTAPTRRVEDHGVSMAAGAVPTRGANMEMERMLPHHPASPIRDSPYQSDLGTQRLQQHAEYYDPPAQSRPLSPAPTYYSTAPAPVMAGAMHANPNPYSHDRFSPQHEYNDTSYTGYTPNATPYPSSRESTQFGQQQQQQTRALSPQYTHMHTHTQQGYSSYESHASAPSYELPQQQQQQQEQDQGIRPPSLLQVGRKPVAGSYREV